MVLERLDLYETTVDQVGRFRDSWTDVLIKARYENHS